MIQRFGQVLLDIWREVCRHMEIGDSATRAAPLLAKRLPADFFLVRHIDLHRSVVETVATGLCGVASSNLRPRSECSPTALARIVSWCRQQQILRQPAREVEQALPGLLPADVDGDILAGPLNSEDGPAGVLIFV